MTDLKNGKIDLPILERKLNKRKKKVKKRKVKGWARKVNQRKKKKITGQPKAAKHFVKREKVEKKPQ